MNIMEPLNTTDTPRIDAFGEQLVREFDQLVRDISVLHNENPILRFIQNRWMFILKNLSK